MKCPVCNLKMKCLETRSEQGYTRRRYECAKCHKRYSSKEELFEFNGHITVKVTRQVVEVPKVLGWQRKVVEEVVEEVKVEKREPLISKPPMKQASPRAEKILALWKARHGKV